MRQVGWRASDSSRSRLESEPAGCDADVDGIGRAVRIVRVGRSGLLAPDLRRGTGLRQRRCPQWSARPRRRLIPGLAARQAALEAVGWMLRGQSTFVQQFHPAFRSPYQGGTSLGAGDQGRNTLSLDILVGRGCGRGGVHPRPAVSRGYGLSNRAASPPSRTGRPSASAATGPRPMSRAPSCGRPSPCPAKARWRSTTAALRRHLPRERITITTGKFPVFDIFDDNSYAHDPRSSS